MCFIFWERLILTMSAYVLYFVGKEFRLWSRWNLALHWAKSPPFQSKWSCFASALSPGTPTARTPTAHTTGGYVEGSPNRVRALWQKEWLAVCEAAALHWVNTSHLSSPGGPLSGLGSPQQWRIQAPTWLLGLASLCWYGGFEDDIVFPLRRNFKGQCSLRCFGPRTASIRCCGDRCFRR